MGIVCPWWMGYLIDNPIRRLFHDPARLLAPHVRPGMTVLDIGCGLGFIAIPAARIVGDAGLVIAVDIQQKMLDGLMARANKAGVAQRIRPHRCAPDDIGQHSPADVAAAIFSIHETPDTPRILRQIHANLKPGGRLLIAEPRIEVTRQGFEDTLAIAAAAGFTLLDRPHLPMGRMAVLQRLPKEAAS